ncbi:MAG: fasciclin domain-containing protein [Bacteroidaceae bacterium]|nr:fasciclin domain-containing protein [Bacteroidaceae bacterium]
MKGRQRKVRQARAWTLMMPIVVAIVMLNACHEDYILDEQEPEWLGSSIYDYLKDEGCYTQFIRLIDDLDYAEVLSKTGSKTLFVVNDSTFGEFYRSNEWDVHKYEDLSSAQKKLLLNSNMLNNVYYTDMLARVEGPVEGKCLRRTTALSVQDSVSRITPSEMPSTNYWDKGRAKGYLLLMKDNTASPMVHFTNKFMQYNGITEEDFSVIHNGQKRRTKDEVFVNGVRIVSANNKCKNGVVHRLEKLTVPLVNMAEAVNKNASSSEFARLMDRFCAPYYNAQATLDYQRLHPGSEDSVYVKRYFTSRGQNNEEFLNTPADTLALGSLDFDPGWNRYEADAQTDMEEDMAVMFVPTNEVLDKYWNEGGGRFLKERYGSWDNVPDRVLDDLISNHMKQSFDASVPSKFYQVKNDGQVDMGVEMSNVLSTQLCNNGVIYFTNRVYPPVAYISVSAPTLVNDNMRVADWAIEELNFYAYLRSMDSYYSFILPTDEAFSHYLDPISFAQGEPEEWEFYYDTKSGKVGARVYEYDVETGSRVREKRTIAPGNAVIEDRLDDIMDYHIIVDTVENCQTGKVFYQTKGKGTIVVRPDSRIEGFDFYGGYQYENNEGVAVPSDNIYDYSLEGNGKTYVTDVLMQAPQKSVYAAISEHAGTQENPGPFYEFFRLMAGSEDVFYRDEDYSTVDYAVKPFNTYHYTVYVPDNQSVRDAIAGGLPDWDFVESEKQRLDSLDERGLLDENFVIEDYIDSLSNVITKFVQYHIQDNSVYVGGGVRFGSFETAAMKVMVEAEKIIPLYFYRLNVQADNNQIVVTDAIGQKHYVQTADPALYNILARDYLFNSKDVSSSTQIETSSFAVIHAINGVLRFE